MIAQGKPDLHVHFIDCGQGSMTLVVAPDSSVLLCDCRVVESDEDRILGYLSRYIPFRPDAEDGGRPKQWIDWFISSHRDEDHLHGLDAVNGRFPVRGIVDAGTTSGSPSGDENQYYMRLRRSLRERYGDGAVRVPVPSLSPFLRLGGAVAYCLCSGHEDDSSDDGHYGNVVVLLEYAGNRILLPGDSDRRAWEEKIVPTFEASGLLRTTLLLASHHGSRSFFVKVDPFSESDDWTEPYLHHIALIRPAMTIVSCGEQDHQNHPHPKARGTYEANTNNKQVYLTRDKGTMVGCFYASGQWTVIPSRFLWKWDYWRIVPNGKAFWLQCEVQDRSGTALGQVKSGGRVERGRRLLFRALSSGGLVGQKASYSFEVSNGGIGSDADHDEIYPKDKESAPGPTFSRDVAYTGVHLLRCFVRDKATGQEAQDVFVVEGV